MPSVSAWLCTWLCTVSGESCDCVCTHESAWERHEDCRLCASAALETLAQASLGQPVLPGLCLPTVAFLEGNLSLEKVSNFGFTLFSVACRGLGRV